MFSRPKSVEALTEDRPRRTGDCAAPHPSSERGSVESGSAR